MTLIPNQHWGGENHTSVSRFVTSIVVDYHEQADLATEWERQLTTARANQTTGLTNGRGANWAQEIEFSPFHVLSPNQSNILPEETVTS